MGSYVKKILSSFKKYLLIQVIVSFMTAILLMGMPYLEGQLINSIVYEKENKFFLLFLSILFITMLLRLILSYFTSNMQYLTLPKMNIIMNNRMIKRVMSSDFGTIMNFDKTYLHSRISEDTFVILNFIFITIPTLLGGVISIIGISIALITINIQVLWAIMGFLIVYVLLYLSSKKNLYVSSLDVRDKTASFFSLRNDIYIKFVQIKAKHIEENEERRLNFSGKDMLRAMKVNFKWNYLLSTSKISITLFFQVVFFLVGGLQVMKGTLTIGSFTIVTQYFSSLLATIDLFFAVAVEYQTFLVSSDRMEEIIDIKQENQGEISIDRVTEITLRNFNYIVKNEKSKVELYEESINFTFYPRNIYSLVGENGVGKSTMLLALVGLTWGEHSGRVIINNYDINQLNLNKFRGNNVAIMLQNEFNTSIKVSEFVHNFVSEDEMTKLSNKKIFEKVFFNERFNIFNYMDKDISKLSGGEQQLLSLFATLGKINTSLVILDEPFSNIFSEMKPIIMELIREISLNGKIIIIVSHDEEIISQVVPVKLVRKFCQEAK